ncbi:MAG: bifunctional methylenetetrahydrofolate dehydrogenase/methenyltetrahydrofolate cyclohydrolase FolD [Pirellulales bacterium]
MSAIIIDGKALAAELQAELAVDVAEFIENNGVAPSLAAVLVGDNPASEVYVRNKRQACDRAGMESRLHRLPAEASTEEVLSLVHTLNRDETVHGILVQLPLPAAVDSVRVLDAVEPLKDVDAFHPENVGRIVQGRPRFLPCTPQGIQQLLIKRGVRIAGRHVVIVGRSDIVGKPLANMLVQRGPEADATVTICHSRTADLAEVTRQADILIVAVGQPRFIKAEMVKPGAVVVDVGINRLPEGLAGDVDFEAVKRVAGMITPVPGGVGPLTVTMLLKNTLCAARLQA